MEEPCRNRPGHLHHRERQRTWRSQVPFATEACRSVGSQTCAWTRAGLLSKLISRYSSTVWNTIGVSPSRIRQIADFGGVFPRLRARIVGNPVDRRVVPIALDVPQNPPSAIALGFTPNRPYVPSMLLRCLRPHRIGCPLASRPCGNDAANPRGDCARRIPASLDRSDRFFTNVERIVQESQLPALGAATPRKFFTTTSAQIEQIKSELDGLIGTEVTLVKFSEDARAANKAANLPAATQSARDAADNSRLASDDLRLYLPAIRESLVQLRELARQLEEQPESVVSWSPTTTGKALMIRLPRSWSFLLSAIACLGGVGCQLRRPATTPTRMIEPQVLDPQLNEPVKLVPRAPNAIPRAAARYTSTRTHRPKCTAPATGW